MKEQFLQYLWNHKIFNTIDFLDTEGNSLEILDFGSINQNAGPDFLMAKIKTKEVVFAGNIEVHLKSSDWIFHNHKNDPNFQNVILHVVYENDIKIEELQEKNIPTLELKNYIDEEIVWKYKQFFNEKQFIPCETIFDVRKIPFHFAEENLLRKLDEKSVEIEESLERFNNDYEAVLFHYLAYAFGLKINAAIFKQMMESIDFTIIKKIQQNKNQLEALFYGLANWLENPEDKQTAEWKKEFDFIVHKFQLKEQFFHPKFLRLRPHNFPTIRLSQLADLYHKKRNLFSQVLEAETLDQIFDIFYATEASDYWDNHFSFGKVSSLNRDKYLTKSFVELLIINAVLPIKYTYHKHHNEDITDKILAFYADISAEKNNITKSWQNLDVKISNALESQAYLYQYKKYCQPKKCLDCSIGYQLMKNPLV